MNKEILVALPNDSLGGAELYLKNITRWYLENTNLNVNIIFLKRKKTGDWSDLEKFKNCKLVYCGANREVYGAIILLWKMLLYLPRKYQIIYTSHVHLTGIIGILIRCGIIKKYKFIGRESTLIFSRFKGHRLISFKISYYFGYPALDLLICQTYLMKYELEISLPWLIKKVNVKVVENPIVIPQEIKTNDLNIDNNIPFIVAAGRYIKEKGFDILIKSFVQIKQEFPNLKLIILGEGPERDSLQNLIKSLKMDNEIILYGHTKNVFIFFKKARLCVVSSRIEGFPNVLLQMIAMNNNVVSTKCAGDIEKIRGIELAEPNNINSLVTALRNNLLSNSSANRKYFNDEINARTVTSFIKKIEQYTNAKLT